MSPKIAESVAKNTTVLMSSQLVTWLSSFVLLLFLPRYLGSVSFGTLYLALSIMGIFQIIMNFGGNYFITKEVSRSGEKTPHVLVNSIGLRVMLWVVSIVAMAVFSFVAGYPPEVRALILILGVSALWTGVGGVLNCCFQGFEMMRYPSLAAIFERIFVTTVGVTALLMGAKVVVIALVMAAGTLLNFLVCVRFTPRIVSYLPKFDWRASVEILKSSLPYFFFTVFAVIYYRIDVIMLSLMTPAAVVGWYGAAYRFFDIVMFLPSIFTMAVFPVLSRLQGKEESGALVRTTQKSLEFIILAGIPISVSMFAFAEQVIKLFFGLKEYSSSVILLQIFSVCSLLVYVDFILVQVVMASDKQRQWSIVTLIAIPVNMILNYFAIPYAQTRFGNGGIGAAITTCVTESFIMVNAIALIPKDIFQVSRIGVLLKGICAGILMAGSVWLMRQGEVGWIAAATVSMAVYVISLLLMKAPEPSELAFIRSFLSFRNLKNIFLPDWENIL